MTQLLTPNFPDYELIDSGDFEKLERFGRYITRRPEPQAIWHKSLPEKEWQRLAHASFMRTSSSKSDERGEWQRKAEMPDLEAAYQTYGDRVEFMMVNLTDGSSETVESASSFIAGEGYTFPVYYDTGMEAAVAYRIYAIPVTYFIDASGEVRATHEGMIPGEALESNIQALLAQ